MTVVEEIFYEEPITWDEAALRSVSEILTFNLLELNKLEDMRAQLDYMISRNNPITAAAAVWMENDEMADFWKMLGSITRAAANALKIPFFERKIVSSAGENFLSSEDINRLSEKIAAIVVRKQRDYGNDNILRFGRLGLLVRVHDKIARLENLTARGTEPNNESVSDNYLDVIGYCTVAMMFERGWFTLPLQEN